MQIEIEYTKSGPVEVAVINRNKPVTNDELRRLCATDDELHRLEQVHECRGRMFETTAAIVRAKGYKALDDGLDDLAVDCIQHANELDERAQGCFKRAMELQQELRQRACTPMLTPR